MGKLDIGTVTNDLIKFIKGNILESGNDISPNMPFSEAGMDSMSIIEVVLFIERKYGVALPEGELTIDNLKTVETLAACTLKNINN